MALDRQVDTSALALVLPQEVWPALQKYRLQFDKEVKEWPPCIVVFPKFVPEKADFEEAAFELAEETKKLGPLKLKFQKVTEENGTCFLEPTCSNDPGLQKLWGACNAALPNLKHGIAEFQPRVQLATFKNEEDAKPFLAETPDFNIEVEITSLALLARNSAGSPFRTPIKVRLGGGFDAVEWDEMSPPYLFRSLQGPPEQVLVYTALAISMDVKGGKLSPGQEDELRTTLRPVLDGSTPEYALAVACWLRDKREVGNRIVPIHILVESARHEEGRHWVRAAAPKILLLPTDLTSAFSICQGQYETEPRCPLGSPLERVLEPTAVCSKCEKQGQVARSTKNAGAYGLCVKCYVEAKDKLHSQHDAKLPACLKKAGKDLLEKMSDFHAAKYDSATKEKRLRKVIRDCQASLAGNPMPSKMHSKKKKEDDDDDLLAPERIKRGAKGKGKDDKGKGKGKDKGKGKGKGKYGKSKGKGWYDPYYDPYYAYPYYPPPKGKGYHKGYLPY
eukprot:TRINITY_DN3766_c0_g1_i1.p1 TRINITY_DN3766_c0_g1~~TRINITY_DN3766_c0_g1_i1.p1  ORF type:complete len:504 (+),score=127.24 TRINITY_DN3766_c0_g1_i1:54-1565(+)